ncbi:MAG: phosphoglucosamine mutase [Actinomycetota bacterium]|nr:phosphoglucosamine mutase [Actinomycetota bacterium]
MTLKFGTDGVRGVANAELTPELVMALGRAAAHVLGGPTFLVGRDTRVSGPLLQAALTAGLASEGVNVRDVGVLPTPAVAALSAADQLPAAVISASHNSFADNGVKLFSSGGRKLSDETERRLEAVLADTLAGGRAADPGAVVGAGVGRLVTDPGGRGRYQRGVLESLSGRRLGGLRVVIDCANGAASVTAAEVLRHAGAELVGVLAAEPNGTNINHGCGSTDPGALQAAIVAQGADVGLAFDGDADRVIAADHSGALIDGDQLLAILALDLKQRDLLAGDTVVVTVMTNLGFRLAMRQHQVAVHETQVGDRYVLEALNWGRWSLGGEQSGHIIFRELATTGDGLLTGLQLMDVMVRQDRTLAELARQAMTRQPQVLRNVAVTDARGLDDAVAIWAEVKAVEAQLGERGRVLLRASGTEPLVRVMVEAPTLEVAETAADRLVEAVEGGLGRV